MFNALPVLTRCTLTFTESEYSSELEEIGWRGAQVVFQLGLIPTTAQALTLGVNYASGPGSTNQFDELASRRTRHTVVKFLTIERRGRTQPGSRPVTKVICVFVSRTKILLTDFLRNGSGFLFYF